MSRRMEKVDELLKKELSRLVQDQTRGFFATVQAVETSPDLRSAKVWVSVMKTGEEVDGQKIINSLQEKAHQFQQILAKRLDLRYIPKLTFRLDISPQAAARVEELLEQEKKNKKN